MNAEESANRIQEEFRESLKCIPEDRHKLFDLTFGIADRIVQLMEIQGVTKRQLADDMGVRPSTVAKWISGQYEFSLDTIAKLTVYFGHDLITVAS